MSRFRYITKPTKKKTTKAKKGSANVLTHKGTCLWNLMNRIKYLKLKEKSRYLENMTGF